MKKKGALELSVTAIVILILAIVMLGLGLGFVRGMFGKVSNSFDEQIAAEPTPAQPSVSDVITLSREAIITAPGSKEAIKVAVFNTTGGALTVTPQVDDANCDALSEDGESFGKSIPAGGSAEYNVLLTMETTTGTSLCRVTLDPPSLAYSKDFTVTVR